MKQSKQRTAAIIAATAIAVTAPARPAHAFSFGAEVAILGKMLWEDMKQVAELGKIIAMFKEVGDVAGDMFGVLKSMFDVYKLLRDPEALLSEVMGGLRGAIPELAGLEQTVGDIALNVNALGQGGEAFFDLRTAREQRAKSRVDKMLTYAWRGAVWPTLFPDAATKQLKDGISESEREIYKLYAKAGYDARVAAESFGLQHIGKRLTVVKEHLKDNPRADLLAASANADANLTTAEATQKALRLQEIEMQQRMQTEAQNKKLLESLHEAYRKNRLPLF